MIVLREPEKCLGVVREESALPCVKSERTNNNSESFISMCTILCAYVLPLVAVSKVKKIPNNWSDLSKKESWIVTRLHSLHWNLQLQH